MTQRAAILEQLRLSRQQMVDELCRNVFASPDRLFPDFGTMQAIAAIQGTIAALEAEDGLKQGNGRHERH